MCCEGASTFTLCYLLCSRKRLIPVPDNDVFGPGKYVVYNRNHFQGFEMWSDGDWILRPTCKRHLGLSGTPSSCGRTLKTFTRIFKVVPANATVAAVGGGDAYGGALNFVSAISGETLLTTDANHFPMEDSVLSSVRKFCHLALGHPPFAMTFFEKDVELKEDTCWESLGKPMQLSIVLRPIRHKGALEFIRAIRAGSAERVLKCLKAAQHPDTHYATGFTALSYSAYLGNVSVVKMLLDGGAAPSLHGSDGLAPLHHAAAQRQDTVVRMLLEALAYPDCRDPRGVTPAQIAAELGSHDALVHLGYAGASFSKKDEDGDSPYTMARSVQATALVMDSVKFSVTWFCIMMKHAYSLSELLGCSAPLSCTCSSLLRRTFSSVIFDVRGGSGSHDSLMPPVPVLNKSPEMWLQICHNRAAGLRRKTEAKNTMRRSGKQLMDAGFTQQQAEHYLASYEAAKNKQTWLRDWDSAMPPMIRQTFGIRGAARHGIRVPLPPLAATLPRLPADRPEGTVLAQIDSTWLQEKHGHPRDNRIRFQDEGHRYYVDGQRMELSVTGLLSQFSEARHSWIG